MPGKHTTKRLYTWLSEQPAEAFPGNSAIDYPKRFMGIADYLNNHVHLKVEKGALLNSGEYLNGHGPEHVTAVIARASEMLGELDSKLHAYEVYLLLVAIHFHDVANILGRTGHEQNIPEIMEKLAVFFDYDRTEMRAISLIARAHGGEIIGDRDTIRTLPSQEPVNNVRTHM